MDVSGLAGVDNRAVCGVNRCADHSATPSEQSQHVDEIVALAAQLCAHQFAMMALRAPAFHDARERYGLVAGDHETLLGLAQAGMVLEIGGKHRSGAEQAG